MGGIQESKMEYQEENKIKSINHECTVHCSFQKVVSYRDGATLVGCTAHRLDAAWPYHHSVMLV